MGTSLRLLVVALLAFALPAVVQAQTNAPRITSMGRTNGTFSFSWTNTGANPVTVERRASLTSGSWGAIASNNVSGAHTDTNPPAGAAFYRLRMVSGSPAPDPAVMALIPAGEFQMGDSFSEGNSYELPVHTVFVSAFYMDRYEVTKALWDEVANWAATNGYDINAASANGKAADHPAYNVTWHEAVKWCNARSEKDGLTPCYTLGGAIYKTGNDTSVACNFSANGYRLPTEAEWEKAARGGLSGKRFAWGDTISHSQANYQVWGDGITNFITYDVSLTPGWHPAYNDGTMPFTAPVGDFATNGYGLYDMVGNVLERCWDRYAVGYYSTSPASNPTGVLNPTISSRAVRGGSWDVRANQCRTAFRGSSSEISSSHDTGFRCARSATP